MINKSTMPIAVVATTPDDSHVWNMIGVQLKLEERGFVVKNLGACTPPELTAEVVRDLRPDILVISTINGHGAISIERVLRTLEQYQIRRSTRIVVGGLLTTDPAAVKSVTAILMEHGCDGVFTGDSSWDEFDKAFLSELARSNLT